MSSNYFQYDQLKGELLSIIQEHQSHLYEEIEKKVKESNIIIEENKRIIECFLEQKYQIDKIENLEKISNKTNDALISHEIKIANNSKELSSIKIKYDKLILDNLMISGLIGPSCQYKNLSSYIKYQISEFSRMKYDNENIKKETKDFRVKIDGMSKNIINLIDSGVLRCNNYADNRINDFHFVLENKIKEMNDKLMEIRMKNIQFQNKIEEDIKNLKEAYEQKMAKQKDDLSQIINKKLEYLNMNYSSLEKNPKLVEMDNNIKNNHSQLEKEIQEIKEIKQIIQNLKNEISNNNNFNYTSYNSSYIHGENKNKQNKKQNNNYKTNQEKKGNPKKLIKNEINKSYTNDIIKLKNNYRNRQLLSPVKSRFRKNNNVMNTASPKNDVIFKVFDSNESSINKIGINNDSIPQKYRTKTNLINLDEKINLIENKAYNFTENINNNLNSNIKEDNKNNSNNNEPSILINNGHNNNQSKTKKIKNTYSLTNAIDEHSNSFISISNISKQDNNEEQNNIEIKKALFEYKKKGLINTIYNKNNIFEKKFQKKNTFNNSKISNNILNSQKRNLHIETSENNESKTNTKRNLHIETSENNESKTNTKTNFNNSQNNYKDEIEKELFSKYNKDNITTNLNLIKNKANLDLYNYSISPPDNRFMLNAKINEIIEPPAKELFYNKANIFDKGNRHCNTKRNISLRPSLNMQIFYGNYNDKKKEKNKKLNYLSTSENKINFMSQKNNLKKINQTFGKTIYSDYVKTEDLFTMTSYKK